MKNLKLFKRFMSMAVIAVALTSCFDFTSSENYTLIANFEYGSELTLRSDSTYYAEKGYAIGYNGTTSTVASASAVTAAIGDTITLTIPKLVRICKRLRRTKSRQDYRFAESQG